MWLLWWWWWFFLFSADVTPITDLGKRVLFGWRLLWFCRGWGGCVGRYAHVCHVGRVCRQMHCSCGRSWWWPLRGRLLPALLWECIKCRRLLVTVGTFCCVGVLREVDAFWCFGCGCLVRCLCCGLCRAVWLGVQSAWLFGFLVCRWGRSCFPHSGVPCDRLRGG